MDLPPELVCMICNDRAEGYHFGAVSCAACGAFFRRSVSDQKTYSCRTRNCLIVYGRDRSDPTRRAGCCRYCRFLKCVQNGMVPAGVQAKRQSSTYTPSIYRSLQDDLINLIDDLVAIRRKMTALRIREERFATGIQMVVQNVSTEYSRLSEVWSQSLLLQSIISCPTTPFSVPSVFRDVLLTYFVLETCVSTSGCGGVQLDRLIFPNFGFIELNCPELAQVFGIRDVVRVCSFLVQNISRYIQAAHFDETIQAVLFYVVITQCVPYNIRNPDTLELGNRMMAGLSELDSTFNCKINKILRIIHTGTNEFKQILFSHQAF